jgi:hypothetical protein
LTIFKAPTFRKNCPAAPIATVISNKVSSFGVTGNPQFTISVFYFMSGKKIYKSNDFEEELSSYFKTL